MDPAKRREIARQLKAELDAARDSQLSTNDTFHRLTYGVSGRIPHPDGTLGIQQAGAAARASLAGYMKALSRYTDFTVKGTVPEGFRLTRERYRALLPVLVQLEDETHRLIEIDSILILETPTLEGQKFITVIFDGQPVKMLASDLRFRSKLEPEPESES